MDKPIDKPWDDSLKKLVRANPQAFVLWLLGKADFIKELPDKLRAWKLEVDSLTHVIINGQEMLLHIEFQTYNDSVMAERLLRYNVLARSEYNLPVLTCVIYLLRDGNIPKSPLSWTVPTGQKVLQFHFESIELGKLTPEELLSIGQSGLLPLLPMTKGGASREVVNTMFAGLQAAGQTELMTIGATLASLVFSKENPADLGWLHRRLHEMHDILRESPFYQEILKEGREEGLQALRQTLLDVVQARFPKVVRLTKKQIAVIDDPDTLGKLIVQVSTAQTMEEAKQQLLAVDEDEEE